MVELNYQFVNEMPNFTRRCKKTQAISKSLYFTINTTESEVKLRTGYHLTYDIDLPGTCLINSYVHRKCYRNVTRSLLPITKIQENTLSDSTSLTDVFDYVLVHDLNINVTSNESHTEDVNAKIFYCIPT